MFAIAWAAWWSSGRIEYGLVRLVGDGRTGLFDDFLDEGVVAVGEGVAALITVESGRKGADVDAFAYSSLVPV